MIKPMIPSAIVIVAHTLQQRIIKKLKRKNAQSMPKRNLIALCSFYCAVTHKRIERG